MTLIIILLIIIGLAVVFSLIQKGENVEVEHPEVHSIQEQKDPMPYVRKQYFMTNSELNFFRNLEKINQNKYFIVPQVSLSGLVSVADNELMRKTYNNKIDRKSVDFVLFDKATFLPKLVIELDDRSHDRYDRKIRDEWVDDVMKKVGIRIVHVKASYSYNLVPIEGLLAG
ncbi:MAG: hypothetical protein JWO50_583 [Candidatus Kaiserbacteria bacterium]|nr:hypothetical protein [Candidatus Kaiserbacteria bacterium]